MNIRSINALKGKVVGALLALTAVIYLLAPLGGFAQGAKLITTFTNPHPQVIELFGWPLAAMGSDRVLISAPGNPNVTHVSGVVYLLNTNGTLLTTLTNPVPQTNDLFGFPVAAVGSDRVFIGAPYAGVAYLFSTNGTLLTTFTSPAAPPDDEFGAAVAVLGNDRVVIGGDSGAAYLFNTDGTLLTVFTNGVPDESESSSALGAAVAAVGSDRVLISGYAAAYLFNTNGTLLTTFPRPTPGGGEFGYSVAAVGTGHVLISLPAYGGQVGRAYLFSTNGTLITTFTNPTPASFDQFGACAAAVGTDRVLISASYDGTWARNAGAAYLFSTNGTLLATLTNSPPASESYFGERIAVLDSDHVLIGSSAEKAYLFSLGTSTSGPAITTITNPTPATGDRFGYSVAAVGTDRFAVGAPFDLLTSTYGGVAYLFNVHGALLTTFTNPIPWAGDGFGWSVAALGSGRVLIGTVDAEAYLFSSEGTLLTTFTDPTPLDSDYFGSPVASLGSDGVLIGESMDEIGAPFAGAVYLFNTNGTLITTFINPTPEASDGFGLSIAAVGNDRVLIGAPYDNTGASDAGAAYLFSTNGTLLTTVTNPTPGGGEEFAISVAALGTDRLLIGADSDNPNYTGGAYLFSTNGTLLTAFTHPNLRTGDWFGYSVAALGIDRVLIGAFQMDGQVTNFGVAYVFSTNGTLLTTITNPTPAASDWFGYAVTALGNDRALISAPRDDAGTTDSGVVHVFNLGAFIGSTPVTNCTITISPSNRTHSAASQSATVNVDVPTGCEWAIVNTNAWISYIPGIGGSSNYVEYTLTSNTGPSRTGALVIGGQPFVITQLGVTNPPCTYSVAPTSRVHNYGATSNSIVLTTAANCPWSIINTNPWISIPATSGSGGALVSYFIAANVSTLARSGNIFVASRLVSITQLGTPASTNSCVTLSPGSRTHDFSSSTGVVAVSTSSNCTWNVVTTNSWISLNSTGTGLGNGTVVYTVATNSNVTMRTGYITIGGQIFTVHQVGTPPSLSLTPVIIPRIEVTNIGHLFYHQNPVTNGSQSGYVVRDFLIDQKHTSGAGGVLPNVSVNWDTNSQFTITVAAPAGKKFAVEVPEGSQAGFGGFLWWESTRSGSSPSGTASVHFENLEGTAPDFSGATPVLSDSHGFFGFTDLQGTTVSNRFAFTSMTLTGIVAAQFTGNGTENYIPHLESAVHLFYSTTETNDPGQFVFIVPAGPLPLIQMDGASSAIGVALTVFGNPGRTHIVECSPDTANWTPIASGVMPPNGAMQVRDATRTLSTSGRFYRIVEVP